MDERRIEILKENRKLFLRRITQWTEEIRSLKKQVEQIDKEIDSIGQPSLFDDEPKGSGG